MSKRKKLGFAFSDEVSRVNRRFGHFANPKDFDVKDSFLPNFQEILTPSLVATWRRVFLASIMIIAFFGLFLRLFHLQVVGGSTNRILADSNRIQLRAVHAPRGVLYDRNGKILAENSPGFRYKGKFLSREAALKQEITGSSEELEIDTIRFYPDGLRFAHILGFTGEINQEELKQPEYAGYKGGDRIGRGGLEAFYESYLKGKDGAEIVEVSSAGKKVRTLRTINPTPGKNLHLSIDATLQVASFEALKTGVEKAGSCCGAVVISDPKTGEILSLVSYPSFDGNAFNDPQRNSEVAAYFSDPNRPLLNRVIAGTYPPGSTFKIVSALAALGSGRITPTTQFEDTGIIHLGAFSFSNWYFTQYGGKDGMVNLVKALKRSNDIYFYRVGQTVGEELLAQVARKVGFGKKVGIDLPGEVDGLIADDKWKRQNLNEVWYPGDTLHMAIGQGYLLVTPIQILTETVFVAGEGEMIQPHLATKISNPDNSEYKKITFEPLVKELFKKEDLEVIREGLSQVTKEGGTAWPFFNFPVPTAGKTGTAEFGHPKNKTHAWYTSYAPVDNPQLVVTVLVEAGGEGSSVAGLITKQIYSSYFKVQ